MRQPPGALVARMVWVSLVDIIETMDAFTNSPLPSGCVRLNYDLAAPGGEFCSTDGIIALQELIAVQEAFEGNPFCCVSGFATSCEPGTEDPIIIFEPTPIQPVKGGEIIAFDVEVHVYGFKMLRGYQLNLEITGPQASYAVISDISVDHAKPTYVFSATPSVDRDEAVDLGGLRMMGALRTGGVRMRSYLTTFRLDRAPGAPKAFSVTVATRPETQVADPDGCMTFPPITSQDFDFE